MPRLPRTSLLRIAFRSVSLRKSTLPAKVRSVTTLGSENSRIAWHAVGDAASPRLLSLGTIG